jgi:hypothetical protein
MLVAQALRQLAAQRVHRIAISSMADTAREQLVGLADDRHAIFERHIAAFVLSQQGASIRPARGRVVRMRAAAVFLVKRTGLSETDRMVIELFNREAQPADQLNVLGLHWDVGVQYAVAAQAARQTQRRAVRLAVGDLCGVGSHSPQYTPMQLTGC